MSDVTLDSKDRHTIVLKPGVPYILLSGLVLAGGIGLTILYLYQYVLPIENVHDIRPFLHPAFWLGPVASGILFLNVNFRLVELGDNFIRSKTWYSKAKLFSYGNIESVTSHIAQNYIEIRFDDGRKLRIPESLMNASTELGIRGQDIIRKLEEKRPELANIEYRG